MPLVWDVEKVADWQHVTTAPWTRDKEETEWHPVTLCLLWSSLSCGWSEITDKNAEEIAHRIRVEGRLFGGYYSFPDGSPCIPTIGDVRMHMGMRTNAPVKTRAQWQKMVWQRVTERAAPTVSMYEKFERQEQDRLGVSNIGSVPA